MTEKKSLSKGGLYYLIYNVLNLAFPFINGIYVAKVLLPESIGAVAAAQNLAQYFVTFAFLGIPTYGLREIAKVRHDKTERNRVFSELYTINFFSTVLFLVAYLILIFTVEAYRVDVELYLVVGIAIVLNAFNISWLYEGMEEFKFVSLRNIIFKAVSFILLITLVRTKEDVLIYACINVIGTAGNYIVNMVCAPRFVKYSWHGLHLKRHMRSIFYLVAVNLAIELYSMMDVTMMNLMCSKESIAFYKYGHQIEKMLLQVVNTFTIVLIPRISYYYKEAKIDEFNRLISKALKLIIIVSLPMIVGIYYTSDFLMVELYGSPYIVSATILKLFSVLLLISPLGYLLGSRVLLATGHENLMIVSVGIGAMANLIGNIVLIPRYAEFGATIASIISEVIVMLVYIQLGKKYFQLNNVASTVLKAILSVAIMGVYLFFASGLPISGWLVLIFQIIGSVFLYFVTMLVLRDEVVTEYTYSIWRKIQRIVSIKR